MKFKIPLFDINYGKEEKKAILNTLHTKWISMGENVKEFEKEFGNKVNAKHAIAVSSGTAALHVALMILRIRPGDEVIVPSLTFVATVNAVRYVGANPVFADITSYDDFSICPKDIRKKITGRTKAIIPMHYAGFPCNMLEIMKIAKEKSLFVVEDASHAPGAEFDGKKVGTIGDIGCFSLFSNKNITCAEGGVLTTENEENAKKARLLRSHGMTSLSYDRAFGHASDYDVVDLGCNYRMDDLRGALALAQIYKLDKDILRRKELRRHYCENLQGIDGIVIPYNNSIHESSNYIFPILLKKSNSMRRTMVRQHLAKAGIQTSVHYPAVHKFSIYSGISNFLPKTEYVTSNEITLPMFYSLKYKEIKYICSTLKGILEIE